MNEPAVNKYNLFADDDSYIEFRQKIIDTPSFEYDKSILPFNNISLISYDEFCLHQTISEYTEKGQVVFSLKDDIDTGVPYFVSGYFDEKDCKFILLKNSYFCNTNFFQHWLKDEPPFIKKSFLIEGNVCKVIKNVSFESAAYLASCILGYAEHADVWLDKYGCSLYDSYSYFSTEIGRRNERNPFNIFHKVNRQYHFGRISKLVSSLYPVISYPNKHIFYLYRKNVCRAFGYLDTETEHFYVCKGSLVSLKVDSKYAITASGKARVRFISEACEKYSDFYRVKKDAKCRNATAAAAYVLGKTGRYTDWKDENGELLSQIYPEHFIRKRSSSNSELVYSSSNSEINEIKSHLFHLKIASVSKIHCYAICEYRPKTNLFILKKNSYISTNSNFYKERQMSYLSHDITCQSLKEATELVLGPCLFDEQTLWKDSNNKSFKDLFVC